MFKYNECVNSPRLQLYNVKIPVQSGSLSLLSNVNHTQLMSSASDPIMVVHPGLSRRPQVFSRLLRSAAAQKVVAVAIDTRHYNQPKSHNGKTGTVAAGEMFRYRKIARTYQFDESIAPVPKTNYYMRKVYAVEHVINHLGIKQAVLVGHSDGGRVLAEVASRNRHLVEGLCLVNAVGTGNSWNGYRRMRRNNINIMRSCVGRDVDLADLLKNSASSIGYALKHPHRTLQEKRVIQATNLWPIIDDLTNKRVDVKLVAALDDKFIELSDVLLAAYKRPHVDLELTRGSHSNAYSSEVSAILLAKLYGYSRS